MTMRKTRKMSQLIKQSKSLIKAISYELMYQKKFIVFDKRNK